jgi:hypothetical protein
MALATVGESIERSSSSCPAVSWIVISGLLSLRCEFRHVRKLGQATAWKTLLSTAGPDVFESHDEAGWHESLLSTRFVLWVAKLARTEYWGTAVCLWSSVFGQIYGIPVGI